MSIELPKMPSQHHHYLGIGRIAKNGYTEDQMREYAQEAARLALERAAKVCEDYGESVDNEWNRKLGAANDLKDVAEDCADAIRALADLPQKAEGGSR